MQNKAAGRLLLAAFAVILCLSGVIWLIAGRFSDSHNSENRNLAKMPSLSLETYADFSKQFEDFYNDHLPFRNTLIASNSALDYYIFHRSSSHKVILGKDGWLFYKDYDDGDPLGCYQGTNLYTDEQLQLIAENVTRTRDFLAEQGKEYVLFIAPNKERMYSEYMPKEYGKPADEYKVLQLVRYLRENTDIRVIYPVEDLMEAKKVLGARNLYLKGDTHWSPLGAYVGSRALLSELGIDIPPITSDTLAIAESDSYDGDLDLADMLHLKAQLKKLDRDYTIRGYQENNREEQKWDYHGAISYTAKGADPRKLYVYRDSYATRMIPFICSQFEESYLRHRLTYTYEDFLEQDPDIFVYEVVERYVDGLLTFKVTTG